MDAMEDSEYKKFERLPLMEGLVTDQGSVLLGLIDGSTVNIKQFLRTEYREEDGYQPIRGEVLHRGRPIRHIFLAECPQWFKHPFRIFIIELSPGTFIGNHHEYGKQEIGMEFNTILKINGLS